MKLKPIVASLAFVGVAAAGSAFAAQQNNQGGMGISVSTKPMMMNQMLSAYAPAAGREMNLIKAGMNPGVIYLGGYAQGAVSYTHEKPFVGSTTNTSEVTMPRISLSTAAAFNPYVLAYVQADATNVGKSGVKSGAQSDDLTISRAYMVAHSHAGQMGSGMLYGFFGKKGVDFGSFANVVNDEVNPNVNLAKKAFFAVGNTAGVGYSMKAGQGHFDATVSAMNGGSTGTNLYTKLTDQNINNFAVNANYAMTHNGVKFNVGAGYLKGTAFGRQSVFGGTDKTNGAFDLNAAVNVNNFDFTGEYLMTTKKVIFLGSDNSKVKAYTFGAAYNFPVMGKKSAVAFQYSGLKGLTSKTANVYTAEFRHEVFKNVTVGAQYSYEKNVVNVSGTSVSADKKDSVFALTATAHF